MLKNLGTLLVDCRWTNHLCLESHIVLVKCAAHLSGGIKAEIDLKCEKAEASDIGDDIELSICLIQEAFGISKKYLGFIHYMMYNGDVQEFMDQVYAEHNSKKSLGTSHLDIFGANQMCSSRHVNFDLWHCKICPEGAANESRLLTNKHLQPPSLR